MSIIEEVKEMNVAFGNPEGCINNPNWGSIYTQARCIPEEVQELFDAIDELDMIEVRDAICDIMVFTIGLAHKAGIDIKSDMHSVFESNMSKFCEDEQQLKETVAKYKALGVEVEQKGKFPRSYVVSKYDQHDAQHKEYPAGKFLKGINFKTPVFL